MKALEFHHPVTPANRRPAKKDTLVDTSLAVSEAPAIVSEDEPNTYKHFGYKEEDLQYVTALAANKIRNWD